MALTTDLISQFVKATRDTSNAKKETILYGTVKAYPENSENATLYVKIDGSDLLTPYTTTAKVNVGDRVTLTVKNHTAIITGNITDPSASSNKVVTVERTVGVVSRKLDTVTAGTVTVEQLSAVDAKIDKLSATHAEFETSTTDRLDAAEADIEKLNVANLDAMEADITNLKSEVSDIDTLIFGSATGDTIHSSFANAVIAQLGDAQIKSAMIESVSADKITAGDIITNNVRVMSEDGKLLISDETIQISDGIRVRVQIGKDASNDYSINIWDQNGNLMFSEGGITDSAIKNAIIRNDMVSETANIAASKLDIDSLFEEINGSTKTIKSSRVYLDDTEQALDIAFKSLSEELSSQGTEIEAIQGKITSKVWQQDIDATKEELSTEYTTLEQEVDSILATVASHTSELADKVTTSEMEAALKLESDSITSSVTATYATKSDLELTNNDVDTAQKTADNAGDVATNAETLVKQLADRISTLVTDGNGTSLMTQTDDGWMFSTADIQTAINIASEGLDSLTNELGNTNSVVNILQQAVDDLGVLSDYIKIGTYEDEPCIELGESDSEFKLRITNTRIMFMEGSGIPAYFTNQATHIKKAVVDEELQQGGFVWKVRSNGNMGLVWKGVSN